VPKLGEPSETHQHGGLSPSKPTEQSKPAGDPYAVAPTEVSSKRQGGRRKDSATDKYNRLRENGNGAKPYFFTICSKFDREKVPLPRMLREFGQTWRKVLNKKPEKFHSWLTEKRRGFDGNQNPSSGKSALE
jgi:hypothetical protein